MIKSETRFGFTEIINILEEKLTKIKYKSQKGKRVVSPSLSYLHDKFKCKFGGGGLFVASIISFKKSWVQIFESLFAEDCFAQMFFEIGILKNFPILTGKHLCWSLFLIMLQVCRPAALLKTDSNTDVFL